MHRLVSQLIVYRNLPEDNLLYPLADVCEEFATGNYVKEDLVDRIYDQIHRLLDIATVYGFNHNLWQNYLTYLLISCENPFAITCEKVGACHGSVNSFAKADYAVFKKLFHYDFSPLEKELGINCFSIITDYAAVEKKERRYNKNISDKVQALSSAIAAAKDGEEVFALVTDFYKAYGVGTLGLNKAFRLIHEEGCEAELVPISNTENITFDDLVAMNAKSSAFWKIRKPLWKVVLLITSCFLATAAQASLAALRR